MKSYVEDTIPIHYDEKFYRETAYHCIDVQRTKSHTTNMFKVMKAYKHKKGKIVHWILANKSLTLNNIRFLEDEGWAIIGVISQSAEIELCKEDFGADGANMKLLLKKMESLK